MLKFFRAIRKKLIEQDNIRKYLLYAIGEIMLVVIGILIALQVNNWNEERKKQMEEHHYMERLYLDVSDDIVMLRQRQELWSRQMQLGLAALAAKEMPTGDPERAWEIVRAFHHTSNSVPLHLRDATYIDMVSSGQLGLIADTDLRDFATLYYNSSWAVDLSSLIPEYRVAVRRIIPPDIHNYLSLMDCRVFEPPHRHILKDCTVPVTEIDLIALANTLISDDGLRGELVYAMSVMNTATSIVEGVILVAATKLHARINKALNGDCVPQKNTPPNVDAGVVI